MATAATIINRALKLIGAIGSGESGSADELADGLVSLNAMIDAWNNDRLMIYAVQDETLTLVNGQVSYTIGSSGNLNTTRPVKIESAFLRVSDVDYPVDVIEVDEYNAIPDKAVTSDMVSHVYYKPSSPLGVLYVYPVPNTAQSLKLQTRVPFTAFAATSTTVALPQGYERALAYNLAIEIAPEYEKEPSGTVVRIANESLAAIKRTNSRPVMACTGLGGLFGGHLSRIETDQ